MIREAGPNGRVHHVTKEGGRERGRDGGCCGEDFVEVGNEKIMKVEGEKIGGGELGVLGRWIVGFGSLFRQK